MAALLDRADLGFPNSVALVLPRSGLPTGVGTSADSGEDRHFHASPADSPWLSEFNAIRFKWIPLNMQGSRLERAEGAEISDERGAPPIRSNGVSR